MKAVVCTQYGPPEVLRLEELATPVPRENEVRIRILATAVTSSDCYVRGLRLSPAFRMMARLALGWSAPRQPVLGMVLSGEVDSVGPDASLFEVGDRVFGLDQRRFGTYAQFVCWPEDGLLATRPANLTDAEAAAIPYGGLLALSFLRKAGVRAGQRVLVFGASGAVGTSAIQLARHLGATVTGVCSTSNMDFVASLGATAVIDYTAEDFTRGPNRYDLILDLVGNHSPSACRRALEPNGTLLLSHGGRSAWFGPFGQILQALVVSRFVSQKLRAFTAHVTKEDLVVLKELAEVGKVMPVIDRTYPLSESPDAIRYLEAGHARGKVVITV